ncbi:MAG: hypothetical protein IPO07_15690 [Haliscomenobacter sp.]|nr:hypothetical protein [Haliscomenobacter sp.]MBK9490049.1 hypothetical protein [Haliscomenobacter sp.]
MKTFKITTPKNRMNIIETYPKIEFDIKPDEIQGLIDNHFIDKELNLKTDITSKLKDSLTKLLYAMVWKNGDLKKIKHIIKGIQNAKEDSDDQNDALVFYQFGKYLTKASGQPIIDQHVIRAFAVYRTKEDNEISSLRKLSTSKKADKSLIDEYKKWLCSEEITDELNKNQNIPTTLIKLLSHWERQ